MSTTSAVLMAAATILSAGCLTIGLSVSVRGRRALAAADQQRVELEARYGNTLPTAISLVRGDQVYQCRWVRFVAVAPAQAGEIRADDDIVVSPPIPERTELTVVATGDVRELFEVVP